MVKKRFLNDLENKEDTYFIVAKDMIVDEEGNKM